MVNPLLPTPRDVFMALWTDGALLFTHTLHTGHIWVLGLFLSTLLGCVLAILMVEVPWLARVFVWPLKLLQIIPSVVFVPIFILVFGFGLQGKVWVVVSTCAFPLVSVLYPALKEAQLKYALVKRILGLGTWGAYKHIYLWACVRPFFSSFRIGITYSWGSAITAELMGSERGLGVYMARSLAALEPAKVWAMAVLTALLVLVTLAIVSWVEKALVFWQEPHH